MDGGNSGSYLEFDNYLCAYNSVVFQNHTFLHHHTCFCCVDKVRSESWTPQIPLRGSKWPKTGFFPYCCTFVNRFFSFSLKSSVFYRLSRFEGSYGFNLWNQNGQLSNFTNIQSSNETFVIELKRKTKKIY